MNILKNDDYAAVDMLLAQPLKLACYVIPQHTCRILILKHIALSDLFTINARNDLPVYVVIHRNIIPPVGAAVATVEGVVMSFLFNKLYPTKAKA